LSFNALRFPQRLRIGILRDESACCCCPGSADGIGIHSVSSGIHEIPNSQVFYASKVCMITQVATALSGYTAHGANCNCGNRIQEWSSGGTEEQCAVRCDANAACVSFGSWGTGCPQHSGYCALFDAACIGVDGQVTGDLCPNPTSSGCLNLVFNKGAEAPTPIPTTVPTPAPSTATATGDPHLQNVHGERFDLMTPGKVTLVNIPRGKRVEDALLAVEADARRLGGRCADMYFQTLNITGVWADKLQAGGFTFDAQGAQSHKVPEWTTFGPLEVKVVHGRTEKGVKYLNLFVKHLGHAGFAVGGLLGEDDHTDAARIPGECQTIISLREVSQTSVGAEPASVAIAS